MMDKWKGNNKEKSFFFYRHFAGKNRNYGNSLKRFFWAGMRKRDSMIVSRVHRYQNQSNKQDQHLWLHW